MSQISALGQKAIDQARRGDIEGALETTQQAIAQDPGDKGLRFFAGMLHSRRGDHESAARQFGEALALSPGDPLVRAELARAWIELGRLDEAEALIGEPGIPERQTVRLQAMIAARRGDHARAVTLYRAVVASDPRDFESLGNLGISLLAAGEAKASVDVLEQALRIRPNNGGFRRAWAEAHSAAGSGQQALDLLYQQKGDPGALLLAARVEELEDRPAKAMVAIEQALQSSPGDVAALAALADLQERSNQLDAFEATIGKLQAEAPDDDSLPLLRARAAYRQGDLEKALELAERAPATADPAPRAQLLGQIHDRLGDPSRAFEAFSEMNRADSRATNDPHGKAVAFLGDLDHRSAILTGRWVDSWTQPVEPAERLPAFLVGFPRSGTTLLDTFLLNDPGVAVSEENPMLTDVSARVGGFERVAELTAGEIESLRAFYFAEAESHVPEAAGRLLVDKFPLGLSAAPLIHRLFPRAPILFLARHPCDVVLSCFMTRFQPTDLGSAFLTLDGTARLYDGMMRFWTKSRELLALNVHETSYEKLVDDPSRAMRDVAGFLGIAWSEDLVDNRAAAEKRGFIKTPSYSQVAEPIYRRAVERWRRYAEQMEPVMPILEPWIDAFGYEA